MTGFVSFVSSGPGDPELLTLKAARRLAEAEVVLFDDLSAGPILSHVSAGAELVAVGKRAGKPSPKQDHVSRLLVDHALTGQRVVRLKSGDSGIFGRLEEEITALREAGVPFEIVPGVPSACAAAAAAGIPLTRRLTARRVQFVTGARPARRAELGGACRCRGDDRRLHGQAHLSGAGSAADRPWPAPRYARDAGRIGGPCRPATDA